MTVIGRAYIKGPCALHAWLDQKWQLHSQHEAGVRPYSFTGTDTEALEPMGDGKQRQRGEVCVWSEVWGHSLTTLHRKCTSCMDGCKCFGEKKRKHVLLKNVFKQYYSCVLTVFY